MPPSASPSINGHVGLAARTVGTDFRRAQHRLSAPADYERYYAGEEADISNEISSNPGLRAALNAHYEDNRNTYDSLYGTQGDTPRPQAESRSAAFSSGNTETNEETATNRSLFNK
jgi:hypothetical protein